MTTTRPDDIIYPRLIPFFLVHVSVFAVVWTGVRPVDVAIAVGLYILRMFAITAGYHRYFSHRSFRTSRVFQFLLAFIAQSSVQQGAIWWAAKHRAHHKYSDTPQDIHSPRQFGFLFAHVGWIFSRSKREADYSLVKDLTAYPELVWLNRFDLVPPVVVGTVVWLLAGWSGLVVGFLASTVVLFHCTFFINSLAHVHGKQRYVTGDDSRNNWWLAILTLGEGWHNNHHYYQSAARQGFRWYEIDITYYILKGLAAVGIVWDLKAPPVEVVANVRRLPRPVVEKTAAELARSFHFEDLAARLRNVRAETPSPAEWIERARTAWEASHVSEDVVQRLRSAWAERSPAFAALGERAQEAAAAMAAMELPSLDTLKARAQAMLPKRTPSLDDIAARAQELLVEAAMALDPEPALATA
jgi:stearoyl-CoA desaturase (delta-9 desaturase)